MGRAEQTFIFLFILLSLASCGKKKTIRISAVNAVTGAPYPGLKYTIRKQTSGGFQENNKTVEEGTLDENGRAVVEMRLKNASYELNIEDPGNLCYSNNISYTFTKNDSNFDFQYKFAECSKLKLHIENVNYQGVGDYFKLFYMGREVGAQGSEIIGALTREGGGCYSHIASDFSNVPMGKRYYRWEVTRNGSTSIFHDTIYLNAGEEKIYDIFY